MKFYKSLASIITLLIFFSVVSFAQEEITTEEWENEMARLTQVKTDLTKEVAALTKEVADLKAKYEGMQLPEDCSNEILALVGATQADVDAFRSKLKALMAKIERQEAPKADRQAELDALKGSKISALSEFFDKVHNQSQRALDAWQDAPIEINYTVVKGDCLWYIAKKKDHYGNGFAWPIIYNANKDQIKNADLIYPKQIFRIPNLTEEEQAKYEKLRKNYKASAVN